MGSSGINAGTWGELGNLKHLFISDIFSDFS